MCKITHCKDVLGIQTVNNLGTLDKQLKRGKFGAGHVMVRRE